MGGPGAVNEHGTPTTWRTEVPVPGVACTADSIERLQVQRRTRSINTNIVQCQLTKVAEPEVFAGRLELPRSPTQNDVLIFPCLSYSTNMEVRTQAGSERQKRTLSLHAPGLSAIVTILRGARLGGSDSPAGPSLQTSSTA